MCSMTGTSGGPVQANLGAMRTRMCARRKWIILAVRRISECSQCPVTPTDDADSGCLPGHWSGELIRLPTTPDRGRHHVHPTPGGDASLLRIRPGLHSADLPPLRHPARHHDLHDGPPHRRQPAPHPRPARPRPSRHLPVGHVPRPVVRPAHPTAPCRDSDSPTWSRTVRSCWSATTRSMGTPASASTPRCATATQCDHCTPSQPGGGRRSAVRSGRAYAISKRFEQDSAR